jgi:hypothetical protein
MSVAQKILGMMVALVVGNIIYPILPQVALKGYIDPVSG